MNFNPEPTLGYNHWKTCCCLSKQQWSSVNWFRQNLPQRRSDWCPWATAFKNSAPVDNSLSNMSVITVSWKMFAACGISAKDKNSPRANTWLRLMVHMSSPITSTQPHRIISLYIMQRSCSIRSPLSLLILPSFVFNGIQVCRHRHT